MIKGNTAANRGGYELIRIAVRIEKITDPHVHDLNI